MAHSLAAPIIVCFSSSGATALRVSRNRPDALILTITPNRRSYRQLSVAWGVLTYMSEEISSVEEMVDHANQAIRIVGRRTGADAMGERYVITAGVPFGRRGSTNLIRVERAM
jgi:pyruvate kinase